VVVVVVVVVVVGVVVVGVVVVGVVVVGGTVPGVVVPVGPAGTGGVVDEDGADPGREPIATSVSDLRGRIGAAVFGRAMAMILGRVAVAPEG
jgi:hypothetical protein